MTQTTTAPLDQEELRRLDAYWRAANYLSVGQIYLLDNPSLTEPLRREESARRLLDRMRLRTALNEGVGILQVWHVCEQQQARDQLLTDNGGSGQDAEADRMIAVVNAAADNSADPDANWD